MVSKNILNGKLAIAKTSFRFNVQKFITEITYSLELGIRGKAKANCWRSGHLQFSDRRF